MDMLLGEMKRLGYSVGTISLAKRQCLRLTQEPGFMDRGKNLIVVKAVKMEPGHERRSGPAHSPALSFGKVARQGNHGLRRIARADRDVAAAP